MRTDEAEAFITATKLAERLCLTTQTLANWRVSGRGPRYVKWGARVRYSLADVNAWLAEHAKQRSTVDRGSTAPCSAP
jgi:predicted DNA-binding transcriptional regulator AlpA